MGNWRGVVLSYEFCLGCSRKGYNLFEKWALLVEDITEIAEHDAAILQGDWWQVDICHDGLGGYQRVLKGAYSLLIFDHMLLDAEGLDMVECWRVHGHRGSLWFSIMCPFYVS